MVSLVAPGESPTMTQFVRPSLKARAEMMSALRDYLDRTIDPNGV